MFLILNCFQGPLPTNYSALPCPQGARSTLEQHGQEPVDEGERLQKFQPNRHDGPNWKKPSSSTNIYSGESIYAYLPTSFGTFRIVTYPTT